MNVREEMIVLTTNKRVPKSSIKITISSFVDEKSKNVFTESSLDKTKKGSITDDTKTNEEIQVPRQAIIENERQS